MTTYKKPNLRGFHHEVIKRNLTMMGLTVALTGLTFYFGRNRPRKKRFAEFYRNYDAEQAAERMREAGCFQSAAPTPPEPPKKK